MRFSKATMDQKPGTSASSKYGAPYNHTPATGQKIGPVALQHMPGGPVRNAVAAAAVSMGLCEAG